MNISSKKNTLGYHFLNPKEITLPTVLQEISGLSFNPKSNTFFTHNDEKGIIYELDGNTKKITTSFPFAPNGDYEAIEIYQEKFIIAQSNGDLLFFDPKTQKTTRTQTQLSSKNDIEGLCYYAKKNSLLLACKGDNLTKKKTYKSIYRFNLETNQLIEKPFLKIKYTSILEFFSKNIESKKTKAFKKRIQVFAPSGIAIHPKTEDIYIISARGSSLIVYSKDKTLKQLVFLNTQQNPQPEGITFNQAGDLFISSEGKNESPKIFEFQYQF